MRVRTWVCVTVAVIALGGAPARAVTLEEVVELSQAGIGEVVLIELIEMDDIAYPLTPSRLRALKGAGVSDLVLLALLRSGRSADDHQPATVQRDESLRTTRSDGCRPRTRTACESVVTRIGLVPTWPTRGIGGRRRARGPRTSLGFGLVPSRPARGIGGRQRSPGPLTSFGFVGVRGFGFSSPSMLTTVTTGTATTTRRESVYWGWGGKKRPGSWNGHSETER